jgi:predicted 3-demethylubiquinone-9 3-methyltransferase (glyoxalase superfamily)
MSAVFELNAQQFMVLNAGPQFKFTEAASSFVECKTQEEVDYFGKSCRKAG